MKRAVSLVLLPFFVATSGPAWADSSGVVPAAAPAVTRSAAPADLTARAHDGAFGLGGQDFWVAATEFMARDAGVHLSYEQFFYYSSTGTGTETYDAHFQLPNGSLINVLRCFVYDADATDDVSVSMWRQWHNTTTNTPSNAQIAAVTSTGSSGYQDPDQQSINHTFLTRSGASNAEVNLYTLIAFLPGGVTTVRLRGCRIFYMRQIAPAPATATFNDVPVGAQLFAEVEAMAASGVTAGCNATDFCPDNPVTRRQMAAFFSRALGLHWPPF